MAGSAVVASARTQAEGDDGSAPGADSAAALRALRGKYRLIILSNVDRASFGASNARLGVEFDLIVTAEDVGSSKPAQANFDALMDGIATAGIAAGQLLHVAESLYHDHEPAQLRGLPSVWIHRRHDKKGLGATAAPKTDVEPVWRFESMADFAAAALG